MLPQVPPRPATRSANPSRFPLHTSTTGVRQNSRRGLPIQPPCLAVACVFARVASRRTPQPGGYAKDVQQGVKPHLSWHHQPGLYLRASRVLRPHLGWCSLLCGATLSTLSGRKSVMGYCLSPRGQLPLGPYFGPMLVFLDVWTSSCPTPAPINPPRRSEHQQ